MSKKNKKTKIITGIISSTVLGSGATAAGLYTSEIEETGSIPMLSIIFKFVFKL